jgi:hypothetical protein
MKLLEVVGTNARQKYSPVALYGFASVGRESRKTMIGAQESGNAIAILGSGA